MITTKRARSDLQRALLAALNVSRSFPGERAAVVKDRAHGFLAHDELNVPARATVVCWVEAIDGRPKPKRRGAK